MAAGLVRGRPDLASALIYVDAIPAAAEGAATQMGGRVGDVTDVAGCDLIVLAVKPKDAEAALTEVGSTLEPQTVLLSVIAGWPIDRIRALAPHAGLGWVLIQLRLLDG